MSQTLGIADALVFRRDGPRLDLVGGEGRGVGWIGIVDVEREAEALVLRAQAATRPLRIETATPTHIVGPYWSAHAALVPVGESHLVVLGSRAPILEPDAALQRLSAELVAAHMEVSSAKLLADELELVHAIRLLMEYRPERVADTARHVAAVTAEALSCDVGVTFLQSDRGTVCEVAVRDWHAAPTLEVETAAARLLARVRNGAILEQELAQEADDALGRGTGLVARLALPIGDPDRPMGVLIVAHADARPRGFTNLCQRIGRALAEAAELLLSQAASRESLADERDRYAREARTDALTGLPNRNHWYELLETEGERLERYGRPCSVVSADVDQLKVTNDRLGHAQGDVLIRGAAQVLALEARATDVVARVGGDEFLVLLPETDEAGARVFVDRVRAAAAGWRMAQTGLTLSLSMGAATARTRAELDGVVDAADQAMYAAKRRPEAPAA
ncbi:MAG TPA: GGDEF domain-containing protein [Candidatus Sulfotelmatobacter sp.]|nr:GGDEF domain-containing protein [Candidatus Sulfotelmatobacter sp.]